MIKRKKLRKYFESKPKISIITLFIILIFLKYVIPPMLLFYTPLLMGSLTPEVTYEETSEIYDNMAERLATSFSEIMEKTYLTGQRLSNYSLFLRVLFYGIIWTTYIAIISFVLYGIRYGIYWVLNKKESKR